MPTKLLELPIHLNLSIHEEQFEVLRVCDQIVQYPITLMHFWVFQES